jgi:prepilin-type N-terminal cleavage/methylation domain-containing protein
MKRVGKSGFTLIEVLVAMVIFAIVSLAITSLMVTSTRQLSDNALSSQAIVLAQEVLEDLRVIPFANMANGLRTARSSKGGVTFTVQWSVTPNIPAAGMNTVDVRVDWNSPGGTKTYGTQTIFAAI